MMTRSAMLGAILGLAAVAACSDDKGAADGKTYVLVHGAWMGAWCWDDVASKLRAQGATVVVVELPAHGADQTPLGGATLDAYVATVARAVDASSAPVVLVGHSMGGVVVTQEAELEPAKIRTLAYVGAYVPPDGKSLFDLATTDSGSHLGPVLQVDQANGIAKVPQASLMDVFIQDGTTAEVADLTSHYRDEPLSPLVTPVHTTAAAWGSVEKAYVYTGQDHAVSPALQQQMTAGLILKATFTLDTGHAPFLTKPDELVAALGSL
jgi:pimeloyl-ACP methyl ester carboxylesterase